MGETDGIAAEQETPALEIPAAPNCLEAKTLQRHSDEEGAAMSESITVPPLMSLEGKAQLIADEIARVEHAGKPEDRRQHVKAHALAHLRAAVAYVRETNP